MPDLGRFFNVDPLSEKYSHNSTYAFSGNKLIHGVELEGLEFDAKLNVYEKQVDMLAEYKGATTINEKWEYRMQLYTGFVAGLGTGAAVGTSVVGGYYLLAGGGELILATTEIGSTGVTVAEAANEGTAVVWGVVTDEEYPGPAVGDNVAKVVRKGVGELAETIMKSGDDIVENIVKTVDIPAITQQFDNFQCMECADNVVSALKEKGISGEILEITTNGNKGMAGNIWSDVAGKNISTNGKHKAVLVDGKVYDNIHKDGIDYNKWIEDLFSPTGYTVNNTSF